MTGLFKKKQVPQAPKAKEGDLGFKDRYGRFVLTFDDIVNARDAFCRRVMGECTLIMDAQISHHAKCINYMAISDHFDIVPGDQVPFYEWKLRARPKLIGDPTPTVIELFARRLVQQ